MVRTKSFNLDTWLRKISFGMRTEERLRQPGLNAEKHNIGYWSHCALLPACRDLGFQVKGKHRWTVELHKYLDQRKLQPPKCRSCLYGHCSHPVPISYIRPDIGDCHTLQGKFSSSEREDE